MNPDLEKWFEDAQSEIERDSRNARRTMWAFVGFWLCFMAVLMTGCGPAHFIGESFRGPKYIQKHRPGDNAEGKPHMTVSATPRQILAPVNPTAPAGPFSFMARVTGIEMCPSVSCAHQPNGQLVEGSCVEPEKPAGCCDEIAWEFAGTGETKRACAEYQSIIRALNCRGACEVVVRLYDPRHEVITASSVTVQISGATEPGEANE